VAVGRNNQTAYRPRMRSISRRQWSTRWTTISARAIR